MGPTPPVPPPPPSLTAARQPPKPTPKAPTVADNGPAGSFLVELLIFNGHPFKDHWAYWVCSSNNPKVGVMIHAQGTVHSGFRFEIKRNYDFQTTGTIPSKRIPLQWVNGEHFDEKAMLNGGRFKIDRVPVCGFEACVQKVKVPEKSLNAVGENTTTAGKKIRQRNCQTWIVESADQLVREGIFDQGVATYLHEMED